MEELFLVCNFAFGKGDMICTQFIGKCHGNSYSMFVPKTSQLLLLKPITTKANYFYKMGTLYKSVNNCIKFTIK